MLNYSNTDAKVQVLYREKNDKVFLTKWKHLSFSFETKKMSMFFFWSKNIGYAFLETESA